MNPSESLLPDESEDGWKYTEEPATPLHIGSVFVVCHTAISLIDGVFETRTGAEAHVERDRDPSCWRIVETAVQR